ncbi:hypothetical protein BOTNAR_0768g00010 [Botryotinia narcissicola]|uniref:Uncharacterized protein n=1 Tax=Botryotinia narcissicola TaxID=278944 RepID=A0A4Z1H683_9HELO|nr:hypothetical protein BOTNAR_0768g00010 [Botryotinia narcissicola]
MIDIQYLYQREASNKRIEYGKAKFRGAKTIGEQGDQVQNEEDRGKTPTAQRGGLQVRTKASLAGSPARNLKKNQQLQDGKEDIGLGIPILQMTPEVRKFSLDGPRQPESSCSPTHGRGKFRLDEQPGKSWWEKKEENGSLLDWNWKLGLEIGILYHFWYHMYVEEEKD